MIYFHCDPIASGPNISPATDAIEKLRRGRAMLCKKCLGILITTMSLFLPGCMTLGQVAQMDANGIKSVDNINLCKAATLIEAGHQRGQVMELSSATIDNEIRTRNLDCSTVGAQVRAEFGFSGIGGSSGEYAADDENLVPCTYTADGPACRESRRTVVSGR